jgi:hypothetical protein
MNSTRADNDAQLASQMLRVIVLFLSAVVVAGLLLILFGDLLAAVLV